MKIIWNILFVLSTYYGNSRQDYSSSSNSVPSVCTSSSPRFLPHATDCQKYYECGVGHAPVLYICSGTTRWDTSINQCNHKDNVPCATAQLQQGGGSSHSVSCRTEYTTVWDTNYVETEDTVCNSLCVSSCSAVSRTVCRPVVSQVCETIYQHQCATQYEDQCIQKYTTKVLKYNETVCNTTHKEDCEFHWEMTDNGKVWAPDLSTCRCNPYQHCQLVWRTKEWLEPLTECRQVPVAKSVKVAVTKCHEVPDKVCTNVTTQICEDKPQQNCQAVHKKVPRRVSRRVEKKVCEEDTREDKINLKSDLKIGETTAATNTGGEHSEAATSNNDAIVFG